MARTEHIFRSAVGESGGYLEAKLEFISSFQKAGGRVSVTMNLYIRKDAPFALTTPTSGQWQFSYKTLSDGNVTSGQKSVAVLTDFVLLHTRTFTYSYPVATYQRVLKLGQIAVKPPTGTVFDTQGLVAVEDTYDYTYQWYSQVYADPATFGGRTAFHWEPATTDFTYRLQAKLITATAEYPIGQTELLSPKTAANVSNTDLAVSKELLWHLAADAVEAEGEVTLHTYNGTQLLGTHSTRFPITVPEDSDTVPTLTLQAVPVTVNGQSPLNQVFVQGHSRVRVTVAASGKYSAQIPVGGCTFTVLGKTYGMTATSEGFVGESDVAVSSPGALTVTAQVVDSRGFSASDTVRAEVQPYAKPAVTVTACERWKDGAYAVDGTQLYLCVNVSFSQYADAQGEPANACSLYMTVNGGAAIPLRQQQTGVFSYAQTVDALALDIAETYRVAIWAADSLGGTSATVISHLPTAMTDFHLRQGGKGAAFGKYATQENLLAVAWNAAVDGDLTLGGRCNGLCVRTVRVWGTATFYIHTRFRDFSGTGGERQTFFMWGTDGYNNIRCGVITVNDAGGFQWQDLGGTKITGTAGEDGVMAVKLVNSTGSSAIAYDNFVLLSGSAFTLST